MKKFVVIMLMALSILALSSCEKSEFMSFRAEEHGIVANAVNSAKSNTKKLNKLIQKARNYEKSEIIFGDNTYYFNTSSPIKCRADNLSFIGNNTKFINTSYDNSNIKDYFASSLIIFEDCENISVEGINFDYLDNTSINGKVFVSSANVTLIKVEDDLLKTLDGNEKVYAVNEIINDSYETDLYLETPPTLTVYKDSNLLQIEGLNQAFYEGSTLVLRLGVGEQIPSFMIRDTNNLTFKNVTVNSAPGATVYCTDSSSNFYFENFNIIPKKGKVYSSNVDGIHLKNFFGEVKLQNCTFVGMGDDSLNVNSRAVKVTNINGNQLTIESGFEEEKIPVGWVKEGDVFNAYNDKWDKLATFTVTKTSSNNITVSGDISALTEGSFLQNTRYLPKITIENTKVNLTRARAFMLRSKDVLVTDCEIKNTALPAIIACPDTLSWFEMSPSENLTIQNCTFENCCTKTWDSVISVKYTDDTLKTYDSKIHKNVTIKNNTFKKINTTAILAAGVEGLTLENNKMDNSSKNVIIYNCSESE